MCSRYNNCICTITIINKYIMKNNHIISINFCNKILFSLVIYLLISCNGLTGIPQSNLLPETHIFLDSIHVQQNSQVYLSWQGDDSDGLIIGYIISWNGKEWFYTQKNDSIFSLKVETSDTNYTFRVSAIDNSLSIYPKEGDIIALANAGAYGFTMASHYNSRFLPAEILIDQGKAIVIRKRETLDDLTRNQVFP